MSIDDSRVEILELHRWAEPLKSSIASLFAETLSRRFGAERVATYLNNIISEPDYLVSVEIRRIKSTGNSVTVDALWTTRRSKEGSVKVRHALISEPVIRGGYEAVVSAYSLAFTNLGREIGQSIQTD